MRNIRGLTILYEDDEVIVINKHAGLLTQETRRGGEWCVKTALDDYVKKGQARSRKEVFLVQRLDRETSGVMMVAKSTAVEEYLREKWNDVTQKTYLARIEGCMETTEGCFESYLYDDQKTLKVHSVAATHPFGKFAKTEWRLVQRMGKSSIMEVKLHSGRKNQIRVHFAEAGHPIIGDVKYGAKKSKYFGLHSYRLEVVLPSGKSICEVAPAPEWCSGELERKD